MALTLASIGFSFDEGGCLVETDDNAGLMATRGRGRFEVVVCVCVCGEGEHVGCRRRRMRQ